VHNHARSNHVARWLTDLKASDAMMIILTLVIAGTGVVGIILVIQGGKDTTRLVDAAEKQALAAQNFSESAGKINTGISEAVDKLKIQAGANQTLALAANIANANTLQADRPWMGAYFNVDGFAVGKTPTYTVTFVNTGKRPAKVTLTQTLSTSVDFGAKPTYRTYDVTPSTSFVVPGQTLTASWKEPQMNPISEEYMKAFESGSPSFRVYAKIEYTDVRTNSKYWTHVCWRYTPSQTAVDRGFSNCTEYNDAK
jgi:uncharacterized repeat protein (TIGR01451 family)